MADAKCTNAPEKEELFTKALKLLAYPVSAAAGYWTAKMSIRNHVYDNVKFHETLDDLRNPHIEELKAIGRKTVEEIKRGEKTSLFANTRSLHHEYHLSVEKRLEDLGLKSLRQRWQFNQPHQKQRALMESFTATGIAIGAMFAMAHSQTLARLFGGDKEPAARE